MAYSANSVRQTLLKKLEIELQFEVTLGNKLSCELTRVAEQMRIREIHTAMLHAMPLTSLNTYGLHALLMTHESDIRLDDVFSSVRNIILTTDSLPDVKYAFATLSRDESHRTMQTREPFSISDHKTVSIGDIIHLESFPLILVGSPKSSEPRVDAGDIAVDGDKTATEQSNNLTL
ncbi:hypothetical protein Tco_0585631 [Tanacetum coccineum]